MPGITSFACFEIESWPCLRQSLATCTASEKEEHYNKINVPLNQISGLNKQRSLFLET